MSVLNDNSQEYPFNAMIDVEWDVLALYAFDKINRSIGDLVLLGLYGMNLQDEGVWIGH
jgi:hypothetical protein